MNKKILFVLACLLPLSLFAQELKFGYFNRAELMQSMPEFLAASKKIDDLSKTYDKEYKVLQDEYQRKGSEFMASKDSLPEIIRAGRVSELQAMEERINTFLQDAQKGLQDAQKELILPVNTKLMNAVKVVGDEQGYVYILDISSNSGIAYWSTSKSTDVTNLIRAKLNLK